MTRFVSLGIFTLLVLGMFAIMLAGVIPLGKFMNQRDLERQTREELHQIQQESKDLRNQIRSYSKDSSIEQLARGEYNLAYPGQKIFVLLP